MKSHKQGIRLLTCISGPVEKLPAAISLLIVRSDSAGTFTKACSCTQTNKASKVFLTKIEQSLNLPQLDLNGFHSYEKQ